MEARFRCLYTDMLVYNRSTRAWPLNAARDFLFLDKSMRDSILAMAMRHQRLVVDSHRVAPDLIKAVDKRLTGLQHIRKAVRPDGMSVSLNGANSQAEVAKRMEGHCWGWKAPFSVLMLPILKSVYPEGFTYLHVVKDPREVVLSPHPYEVLNLMAGTSLLGFNLTKKMARRCPTGLKSGALQGDWAEVCPSEPVDWSTAPTPNFLQHSRYMDCLRMLSRAWRLVNLEALRFVRRELMPPSKHRYFIANTEKLVDANVALSDDEDSPLMDTLSTLFNKPPRTTFSKADKSFRPYLVPNPPADLSKRFSKSKYCHPDLIRTVEREVGDAMAIFGYEPRYPPLD